MQSSNHSNVRSSLRFFRDVVKCRLIGPSDRIHRCPTHTEKDANVPPARDQGIHAGPPRIDQQGSALQARELCLRRNHDESVTARACDDGGAAWLVTATEQEALAANR